MSELEEIVNSENKPSTFKNYLVDTSAAIMVYTPLMASVEYFSGMDSDEILKSRLFAAAANTIITRPYTIFREWWAKQWKADAKSSKTKKFLVDTSAMVMVQTPLYSGILYSSGASLEDIAVALPSGLIVGALSGRPFGYVLDKWRKLWGTKPTLDE